jgi:hypothetical protein
MNPQIESRPSYFLAAFLLLIYLGAMLCILFLLIPWWVKIVLLCCCSIGLIVSLQKQVLFLGKKAVIKIWPEQDGKWCLLTREGEVWRAQLQGDSVVTRYFIILNFSVKEKHLRLSRILFRYEFEAERFRRLQLYFSSSR